MKTRLTSAGLLRGAASLLLAAAVSSSAFAADKLKIGFVYVGPIGDAGWTYEHDLGRQEMEAALGDKIETSYVESVSEGADSERVIRKLAQSHDLVFTTSFGYMNPTLKVAKAFPKGAFMHATGYKRSKNVGTYSARFYEGRYLTGVIAGHMTKTNTIGYVAAFPIPEVVQGINAFTLGMRSVNPKAEVKVVWINSWYDPAKEREAAEALIAQGADIINQHTDSPAPVQAAEEKGVYAFGYDSDMTAFGPKAHLTGSVVHWGGFYTETAKAVLDGTWKADDTWGGMAADMVKMAPYNAAIPKDVVAQVEGLKTKIIDGSFHPFQGPIKNQQGKVVVPEGTTMKDGEILSFNWYVEGVQGELPK
ncbi:BMP family ABC transporter substrate-binding protein [Aestuariirhabdus sp. Z084]|uniref:BMP family ABC transporter substrate-binding protein n=1 Tax=Aestuariirhabdus haliotis TaxID=2918751 RepID=UPI00201B39DD|nr:BMP family ABC transporter substrate-binding protein [Aestuariirhabdus haliotis]MCL6415094.1 BMP family ABC transporter substrate-binding protein [Aestuariirhabdus haliotis]MCL6419026.1 BMP family ABC transporter substrate-binding protein [Aestuariirhabdus haliotis]